MRIYSLKRWGQLRRGLEVKVLKGDDSALFKKAPEKLAANEPGKIESEEDLYNDTSLLNEDLDGFALLIDYSFYIYHNCAH